jgi:hypothetical protein
MMQNDVDNLLNDLLVSHHKWSRRVGFGKGYPGQSASCKPARASRQYDDENGALDCGLEDSRMAAFDAVLYRIPQPHLTALQFHARNMATGVNVWSSPRLPVDLEERHVLLLEARNKIMKELALDGIFA